MIERFQGERRRSPRILVDLPLEFVHPFPREVVRVKNISQSGVCCMCDFPLSEMTRVGIILNLPCNGKEEGDREKIQCEGAVVRCAPKFLSETSQVFELAIFFTEISEDHRDRLQRFIESRLVQKEE